MRRRRVLYVAEKPSVAKAVAMALSGGQVRQERGLSQYNALHHFSYTLNGQACDFTFTSVTGQCVRQIFACDAKFLIPL